MSTYSPTFSRRTQWNTSINSITQSFDQIKNSSKSFIDLTISNPTKAAFDYPDRFYKELSKEENLIYDPLPGGTENAKQAVVEYYRQIGVSVSTNQILLTASTSEAYSFLFRLLAEPNDSILFPRPSYPLFSYLAEINDVHLVYYNLNYESKWVLGELNEEITDSFKAMCVVNPNNPTSSYIKANELRRINEYCRCHNLTLIADEVFYDYKLDSTDELISLANNDEVLTFVLGGLSKTLGLPQMKLSWILMNGPAKAVEEAKEKLEIIADTFLSVNTPVQNCLAQWLESRAKFQSQILERIKSNLQMAKSQLDCLTTEGGWYLNIKIDSKLDEEKFVLKLLEEKSVYVHPGFYYDYPDNGYLVLSLLTPSEQFSEGIKRIKDSV